MFINPIQKINSLNEINKIGNSSNIGEGTIRGELPFKNIFSQALSDYKEAETQVNNDIYGLVTGQSDDLHNLSINMKKAEMSFELFVQLRNKALDVYKELMNTGI